MKGKNEMANAGDILPVIQEIKYVLDVAQHNVVKQVNSKLIQA